MTCTIRKWRIYGVKNLENTPFRRINKVLVIIEITKNYKEYMSYGL